MNSEFENSVTSFQIFVASKCMLSVLRPSYEVDKEGRILNFVSGYRKFYSSLRLDASNHIIAKRHQFDSGTFWDIFTGW